MTTLPDALRMGPFQMRIHLSPIISLSEVHSSKVELTAFHRAVGTWLAVFFPGCRAILPVVTRPGKSYVSDAAELAP